MSLLDMTADAHQTPSPSGRRFLPDIFGICGAILIGLFAALVPFAANHQFFFNDDEQNQHFPYYIDIGQHLHHHQWPGISLSTFYGGNLLIDWQYTLLNPVNLPLYWVMSAMQNLLLMGLLFFGFYLTLFSVGCYGLGRAFGLSRIFSLSIAACMATNNYLQYFYCYSWPAGLASLSWFVWTWALLEVYRKGNSSWALGGMICAIYLTITSGWPHTMLMLGVLMFSYLAELIFIQRRWDSALKLVLANAGALLTTSPYLLPTFLSFSWMDRPSGIHSSGLLMPDLGSVLNFSSIFYIPRMHLFWHDSPNYPLTYLAWFIVPLLPLCSWPVAAETIQKRWGLIIFGSLALFFLFGPENFGPLRWPLRFLPFFHLTVLLVFFSIISQPGIFQITRKRLTFVLGVIFLQYTSAISSYPIPHLPQEIALCFSLILVTLSIRMIYFRNLQGLGAVFLGGVAILFPMTHLMAPTNVDLSTYVTTTRNDTASPAVARPFTGYQLFMGPKILDNMKEVRFAAEGIYIGAHTINGYSPLLHSGFTKRFHSDVWLNMDDTTGIDFLLSREPTTNQPLLSLMRVNRLLIYNDYVDHARPLLGKDWVETSKGTYSIVLDSSAPNRSPTTLSFASDGIVTQPLPEVTGEREQLQIIANSKGGQLVFARLYWPGYEAFLDGHPVPVSPLDKIFVKIDLPPGSLGKLTLKFVPPGWTLGLILAALGAALCSATLLINRRGIAMRTS